MSRGRTWICVLSGFALCTSVMALTPDFPYQGITNRNVFNLKPPPAPGTDLPPAAPPPKITLTGITTILGKKLALLSVAGKPGQPPESYMLTEGQRDGEIEVLQIDENAGAVKVVNHGTEQTLDFLNNGAKPGQAPPVMPNMGAPQPAPAGVAVPQSSGLNPNALKTIPVRPSRLQANSGLNPGNTGNTGLSTGIQTASENSEEPMSPEEQAILIEANKMRAQGKPEAMIYPPTGLIPDDNSGQNPPAPPAGPPTRFPRIAPPK